MGKKSKKQRKRQDIAFGAALSHLRDCVGNEVSEILEDAQIASYEILTSEEAMIRNAMQTEALYDGVLEALARDIIDRAYGGEEILLAQRISQRLIDIVEIKTCCGRA